MPLAHFLRLYSAESSYTNCSSLSFFSQLNNFSVFSAVSVYQPLAAPRCTLHGHLWTRDTKTCGGANRQKPDSLQVRSEDCIQTVWQSTLISPCWAAWCYWARPCTSVSLHCTQWAKPMELMGNGREIGERRRERWRANDVPRSLMHIIPSHKHQDSLR